MCAGNTRELIEVSCALILRDGRVLATRRSADMPHPLKWEFPGGKLRRGESVEESVVREIREELGVTPEPLRILDPVVYHYPDKRIRLHPVHCRLQGPELTAINLAEHDRYAWIGPGRIDELDWLEADLGVVEQVRPLLS